MVAAAAEASAPWAEVGVGALAPSVVVAELVAALVLWLVRLSNFLQSASMSNVYMTQMIKSSDS